VFRASGPDIDVCKHFVFDGFENRADCGALVTARFAWAAKQAAIGNAPSGLFEDRFIGYLYPGWDRV
jgi:hypothetical protein